MTPPVTTPSIVGREPAMRPEPPYSAFTAAKQLYAEQYGDAIVSNTYLKIAVAALTLTLLLVSGGLLYLNQRTTRAAAEVKPLVYRVDKLGRIDVLRHDVASWRPAEAEIKYALSEFCRRYYARSPFTIRADFAQARTFLSEPLSFRVLRAWEEQKTIEKYLANQPKTIDVVVGAVAIDDLRQPPYKAQIDFDQVYYADDRSEKSRLFYVAHLAFRLRDSIPPDILGSNPVGIEILDFREDAVHTEGQP